MADDEFVKHLKKQSHKTMQMMSELCALKKKRIKQTNHHEMGEIHELLWNEKTLVVNWFDKSFFISKKFMNYVLMDSTWKEKSKEKFFYESAN